MADDGVLGDVEGFAGKKVGPAPMWVWGVLVAGVILLIAWFRNARAGSTAATDTGGDVTSSDNTLLPDDSTTAGTGTLPQTPAAAGPSPIVDAASWAAAVIAAATSLGGATPLEVESAVQRYLSGQPLSAAQQAIINAALARFPLPAGVLPSPSTATTTTTAAAALTLTPSGSATPSHKGQPFAGIISYSRGGKPAGGTVLLESKSAASANNWTIIKTLSVPSSGRVAVSVPINVTGAVQLRATDLGTTVSNVVPLNIAAK